MTTELPDYLRNMLAEELQPILHQMLGADASPIGPWSVAEIGRSAGTATAGIFRVTGSASTTEGVQSWSAVVKVLGPPRLQGREFDPVGAQRELAVYRSGVFASQQDRVRSPQCFAIHTWNDLHLIWLEDLAAAPQPPWIPAYFVQAAQNVGQFNGRWAEPNLPDWTWLSPDGLREKYRSPNQAQAIERLPPLQQVSVAGRTLPSDVARSLLKLWQSSEELFAKVEETSKCLCHRDYHAKNLFPIKDVGTGAFTVAIDWDHPGIEHPGADIGLLLASPIKWMELSLDEGAALIEPIFDAYLAGLAEAGWSGNEDHVRLTYLTCLGSGEASRLTRLTAMLIDYPERHASIEQLMQHPIEQIFERWMEAFRLFLTIHDRALQLAKKI